MKTIFDMEELNPILRYKSSIMFHFIQSMVKPTYNDSIDTAQVVFDAEDLDKNVLFEFNPEFWDNLNIHEKTFVFIHEILHVMLFHGSRGKTFFDSLPQDRRNHKILNQAMDICINEMIMREFVTLPLSMLPNLADLMCSIKNCFPDNHHEIIERKSFVYYYHKLMEQGGSNSKGFDVHLFENISDEDIQKIEEMLQGILTVDQIEELKQDDISGFSTENSHTNKVSRKGDKKRDLNSYLQDYISDRFGGHNKKPKIKTKWYGANRRNVAITRNTNMSLPIYEELKPKIGKSYIVAYCDVSGSVSSKSKEMMNLLLGLDTGRFEVEMYAWASTVSEVAVTPEGTYSHGFVGGGTDIHKVLTHYKQKIHKKKPAAVIVLTDGDYYKIDKLDEQYYNDWVFFMVKNSNNAPVRSKVIRIL